MFIHSAPIGPTCATEEPLVTGSTPIPDGQMTASSIYYGGVPAYNARLNFGGAWCPSNTQISSSPPSMWIQVGRKMYMYYICVTNHIAHLGLLYFYLCFVCTVWHTKINKKILKKCF